MLLEIKRLPSNWEDKNGQKKHVKIQCQIVNHVLPFIVTGALRAGPRWYLFQGALVLLDTEAEANIVLIAAVRAALGLGLCVMNSP